MASYIHNPTTTRALARAISAALPIDLVTHPIPTAPHGATKTHAAPQPQPPLRKTNPPRPSSNKPLNPNQLTAARLLLAGHRVIDVASILKVDPYTVSRWKKDPRFQSELHYQIAYQSIPAAPQKATPRHNSRAPAQNEATQ
jgi:DNA-binding NarL/FixJ family response regulator